MKAKECKECCVAVNPSHIKQKGRINRIIGQLEGIKKMIDDNRYCLDIMIQLKAVRSAIKSVESNILESHLHSCVSKSFDSQEDREKKIEEIKDIFNKFHN